MFSRLKGANRYSERGAATWTGRFCAAWVSRPNGLPYLIAVAIMPSAES
jgi:hypothetical protein